MADTDVAVPLEDGPWTGILDSVAPTAKGTGKYLQGVNIYPLDPEIGEGVVGRPGVRQMGAQLGAGAVRRTQGIFQFTKENGTEITVAIVGGKFYTLNWATEVWTEVLTAANLAGAAITLSATQPIGFVVYNDTLLVSDGVNTPWTWDGTTGAGLVKLTNAPAFYGQPAVYYGRIFGIKASEPTVLVWSETDLANTGYEAGGYNNSWSLTQTDPNRLFGILGTNDSLIVARARSATSIGGSVTSNFSSAATRDSVSDTEGTQSPFALVLIGVNIMLLDADLHPQLVRPGGSGLTQLWTPMRENLKRLPKTPAMLEKSIAVNYTPAQLVLISVADIEATEPNLLMVFDAKEKIPIPVAVWSGWEITSMSMVKSGVAATLGRPYLFHGGTDGRIYLHGHPDDDTFLTDDALASGTIPIRHVLETMALGYSTKREKIFDRIDISSRSPTEQTLDVSVTTPRGRSTPQTIVLPPGIPGWDFGLWDEMEWDTEASTQENHADVGIDEQARWVKVLLEHETLGEQFGVNALTVTAYTTDDDPEVP